MNIEFVMHDHRVIVSDVQYKNVKGSYNYNASSDMDYSGYEDFGFSIDSVHDTEDGNRMLDVKEEGAFISEHYEEIYDTILKMCRAWESEDNESWYP